MKLSEIQEQLEKAEAERKYDEELSFFTGGDWWNLLPRCEYKDLPASLQKQVRQRFTPETIRSFLCACYTLPDDIIPHTTTPVSMENIKSITSSYFDSLTRDIPEDDIERILIRTRNTATYTIEYEPDGQLAPMLFGNHATLAFETTVDKYRERLEEKRKQEQAKNQGQKPPRNRQTQTLVSAGYYQYIISDKKYQGALTTQQNKNAYIALMQPDFFARLDFKNGIVTYDQEMAGNVKKYSRGKYTDVQDLDFPLLIQIYTATIKANIRHDAYTITVSLPRFFREMGIDISHGNAPDIMAKLRSFENCVGIMPGTQTVSKLFTIIEVDFKNQTMTFACPYILKLYEVMLEKNHVERKTRRGELIEYILPFHNTLCHSTIAKERNKTAVELVQVITTGLLQRGYVPDIETYRRKGAKTQYPDRVTYDPTFRDLINKAPLLRGRIASYADTSNKNSALRRAFEKAYQLIDTKTDAAEWFINLKCNRVIPTMATLDDKLIFTHDGRNGDYTPKK